MGVVAAALAATVTVAGQDKLRNPAALNEPAPATF
jgi:hypothetical protein